jgi:hypothetical protein
MIEWRIIPSFPWLQASSDGRVRWRVSDSDRKRKGTEIKGSKSADGYIVLQIRKNGRCLKRNCGKHVLVCEAFHGPRPSEHHEAAHWDGVRTNNSESNLRWATPKENAADRKRHGRDNRGNQHGCAKLTTNDVFEIRRLRALGFRGSDVATLIDANKDHINKIAAWTAWSSVGSDGCDCAILSFGS